ncbi:MAG: flagellar basal body P-ring formation protein FlgA [Verrucomicrobia bacterium]|nr:flagellar basal body P-ring formation protein FlgA [Verrucomicrobiota bacterium]
MRRRFLPLLSCVALAAAAVGGEPAAARPSAPGPLSREHFVQSLGRELAAHFSLDGNLQLELLRPWAPPARVAGAWTVQVLEFPAVPASSMLVRCRALADGEEGFEWNLVLRASLWREAWAARLPLAPGAIFDAAQLEARRVDLFRERDVVPAAVGDRSYVYARSVQAGRMLTWRDITRRPLVKKGHIVEVSAAEGLLLVTLKALALENGAQGDTVTVRNPESQKTFAAIVVDENRVQVRF